MRSYQTLGAPRKAVSLFVILSTVRNADGVNRGYALAKIQENNEAEIMQIVLDEAKESYAEEIVVVLSSEGPQDIDSNVSRIAEWIVAWRANSQAATV